MNKNQIILVTFFMLLTTNFVLPMILSGFDLGFDLPLFGHITLFDSEALFGTYSFMMGGVLVLVLVYFMWQERRGKT